MSNDAMKRLRDEIFADGKNEGGHCCASGHCWHGKRGAIWMVVKDGHVIQECCRCPATRSVHADHARDACLQREDFKLRGEPIPFRGTPTWGWTFQGRC